MLEKNGGLLYTDHTGGEKLAVVFGPAAVETSVTVLVVPLIPLQKDNNKGLESLAIECVDFRDFDISRHEFAMQRNGLSSAEDIHFQFGEYESLIKSLCHIGLLRQIVVRCISRFCSTPFARAWLQ